MKARDAIRFSIAFFAVFLIGYALIWFVHKYIVGPRNLPHAIEFIVEVGLLILFWTVVRILVDAAIDGWYAKQRRQGVMQVHATYCQCSDLTKPCPDYLPNIRRNR